MKATDYLANRISWLGVRTVFGYQGGNIAHMIDSVWRHPAMEFISAYHEQGASFSACGYAMENHTIGVALASSGPGAVNLISGIANAYYDSIPVLFITGNVSTHTMKESSAVRQKAFQENDIVSMVSSVTKYAVTVTDPHDLRFHFEKAVYLAESGRPGPVLLDLPHNIQKAELHFDNERSYTISPSETDDKLLFRDISYMTEVFKSAKRPLIVAGGGAGSDCSKKLINRLLEKWRIPVVVTLRGLDIVSHKEDCYIGFGGAYGNRAANCAVKYADAILVLGSRLDERFLCIGDKSLFSKKRIIHVDIDPVELRHILPEEYGINMEVSRFISALLTQDVPELTFEKWTDTLRRWKKRYQPADEAWTMNKAVSFLSSKAPEDAVFCLDIGINQMCAAQALMLNGQQHCFTSAGHGAMGCSVPTGIGAAFAAGGKTVNCFVGDGALHMNIQELLMLSRYSLPVHVLLMNNRCLGMIRDFQTKAFANRFAATVDILQEIDYRKIADAYHLEYCSVQNETGLQRAAEMMHSSKPCFIELLFAEHADTNPKLGTDMFTQTPLLSDEEIAQMEEEALLCGNIISW